MAEILVVDDDPAIRKGLETRLTRAGHAVRAASCGEDALLACSPEAPDVVILDVSMPGLDGYQVCERIREYIDKPVAVIFLTGATHAGTSSHLERLVHQSGGDYYIAKPYDPALLLGLIERVTRGGVQRDGVAAP